MMVTSLSLTAEFINNDTDSSAFIYGLMSFTDKLLNGVGVFLIQHLTPDTGYSLSEAQLKFIYSESATKFCKISTNYLSYVLPVK